MGVAVVHGDGRIATVTVVLCAPAAADQPAEIDVEAVVLRTAAIDAADHEIGVVAGDDVLGHGGGAGPAGCGRAGHGRGPPTVRPPGAWASHPGTPPARTLLAAAPARAETERPP